MKKFISFLVMCGVMVGIAQFPARAATVHADVEKSIEYMEYLMGNDSPELGTYITWKTNEQGEFVRIPSGRAAVFPVVVKIGKVIVAYLVATVIDGIVVSATGKSGTEWVSGAIRSVLNRPYQKTVYLDCSIYPTYSAIYGSCMAHKGG